MSSLPFITLFSSTLILGSFLALSGNHWIFIWIGLELNLISFIPLLTSSQSNQETEAAIKYFIAQALGRGLLLIRSLSIISNSYFFLSLNSSYFFLLVSLLIKLGLPPCHFWFPSVISTISWPICLILATWQKLVPILLLFYIFNADIAFFSISIILIRSLIGGIGGLNQTQLRSLLAYSSIGHISWILGASLISFSGGLMYFLIYILITAPIIIIFWFNSNSLLRSITSNISKSNILLLLLVPLIISLGGIPPFTGFFPKWIVIEILSPLSSSIILILLIGSIINLFYYLNLGFIRVLKSKTPSLVKNKISSFPLFISIIRVLSLGLRPFFLLIIYALTILYKS